jgi:hypothetical protein
MEYALVEKYSSSSLKGISKYKFKLDANDQINSVSQPDMRYKILNKKAVQEITRSHYKAMMKYAKSEKLKLNTLKGLMKFFDYYSTIK